MCVIISLIISLSVWFTASLSMRTAGGMAGAASLLLGNRNISFQQRNHATYGNTVKSNMLNLKIIAWIVAYVLSLIVNSLQPCLVTPLNQQLSGSRSDNKHLVLPLQSGFTDMRLTTGQFATYCSVLNHGKANLHNIKYKNKTTKSSKVSWKFTGYLFLTLLLAGNATVRDMDSDQYLSTTHAANSAFFLNGMASYVGYTGAGDDQYATRSTDWVSSLLIRHRQSHQRQL